MKKILAKKYKRFILYLEILVVIVLIPVAYNFMPVKEGTKIFYMPSSDPDYIVQTLKVNGYGVTWLDKMILGLTKIPEEGWYSVAPADEGRFLFFRGFYKYKSSETMDIVVYAGETKNEVTARLANDMKLDQKKLLETYQMLAYYEEADILAQRYTLARKAGEEETMKYIFLDSRRKSRAFEKEYFKHSPDKKELKIVYVIASIIQKESNSVEEMGLISSVIYNRLEKNMKLQMDGTLNYGKFAHTIVTPERIKSDTSLYNTYKHKGLPPHPLSTVTIEALRASMKPMPNEYLFFMLNKTGTHDFTETYDKHLENVSAFRAYQKERKKQKEQEANSTYMIPSSKKLPFKDNSVNINWDKVSL
ncbi:MAG: hypothetical protein COB07_06920 [Sulfurovum sp.]|nr:MAG: hypothetical protein COB07_06920 [Sulfurovum sp.]